MEITKTPAPVSDLPETNHEDNPNMVDPNEDLNDVMLHEAEPSEPLRVLFRCPASDGETARFRSRPLGVTFEPGSKPLKVASVAGLAAALGVQPGWTLQAMRGMNPSNADRLTSRTSEQILEDLKRASQVLPYVENPTSMEVVFQSEGTTKAVAFTRRPLGLTLSSGELPATVTKSSGYAAELGVQVGWTIRSVGPTSVVDSKLTFDQVAEILTQAQQRLPYIESAQCTPVVFKDKHGQPHRVVFEEKPLGVRFAGTGLPLTVTGVNQHAEVLGVEEGWVVTSIAGTDLEGERLTFEQAQDLFKREVAALPNQAKPKLDLVFAPDTTKRLVTFTRRPLDIDFMEGPPLTVLKAGGHGAELGVQPGWAVTAFGAEDASRLDHARALQLWKEAEARLPLEAPWPTPWGS